MPARRPGGRPETRPPYRLLVHRHYRELWDRLAERVGLQSAQQCYAHLSTTPGQIARINRTSLLKSRTKRGKPIAPGFSQTIHYEISGAGRVDYQYHPAYVGRRGDPHPIVVILRVDLESH